MTAACPPIRLLWLAGLLTLGCKRNKDDSGGGSAGAGAGPRWVDVRIEGATPLRTNLDPRFLSVAVDSGQVAGTEFWADVGEDEVETPVAPFDFDRPELRTLTRALAPAYLRIGGTDADHLQYDLSGATDLTPTPPYTGVLDAPTWDRIGAFAQDTGLDILFTLNAGLGPRDDAGAWTADEATALIEATVEAGYPVDVWELGNELNAFPLEHGFTLTPEQYAADLRTLAAVRDAHDPGARVAGPSVAYWPVSGELLPYMDASLSAAQDTLDIVTWHYYPQQSQRCPAHTREAGPKVMLDPLHLDEVLIWQAEVHAAAAAAAPDAEVWLGETGNAQCGGEPGVSDRWASSFWWMDQLGLMARTGTGISVRQTLAGSDYGLLDAETLEPRPDYWASLLWRQTMGTTVLDAETDTPELRIYAHCALPQTDTEGVDIDASVAVLLINLDQDSLAIRTPIDGLGPTPPDIYVHTLRADDLDSVVVKHNRTTLTVDTDGAPPSLSPNWTDPLVLPGRSITVALLEGVEAPACGSPP